MTEETTTARGERYRGKVQVLYTYVHEAHPNPAQAPCGATEDLGWEHASGNTRSKAERAQRARWLGQDFNLNFPWIIDDTDDTIFFEFWPYRFYVGPVLLARFDEREGRICS